MEHQITKYQHQEKRDIIKQSGQNKRKQLVQLREYNLTVLVFNVLISVSTSSGARVLVAGGTGYIGSSIVQTMLNQGARVSHTHFPVFT